MLILADDLSGAQECIAAASWLPVGTIGASRRTAATVLSSSEGSLPQVEVLAIDTNSRCKSSTEAATLTNQALVLLGKDASASQVFLKFDSILRGNIAAQLRAASEKLGPIVFCPAVPDLNRATRDGIVYVNGLPLAETGLWHLESEFAPNSITEVMADLDTANISLAQVRSDQLSAVLRNTSASVEVVICDAQTVEDLDALATAITECGLAAAGASGLCAALARVQDTAGQSSTETYSTSALNGADSDNTGIMFVIGTASEQAKKQVKVVQSHGVPVVPWQLGSTVAVPDQDFLVTVSSPVRPEASSDIDQGLAELVASNHRGRDLFLTGGQTARSILDVLNINELRPIAQPEFGTVISTTPDGRLIVTRPGSFGSTDNLLTSFRMLKHLRALYAPNERTSS